MPYSNNEDFFRQLMQMYGGQMPPAAPPGPPPPLVGPPVPPMANQRPFGVQSPPLPGQEVLPPATEEEMRSIWEHPVREMGPPVPPERQMLPGSYWGKPTHEGTPEGEAYLEQERFEKKRPLFDIRGALGQFNVDTRRKAPAPEKPPVGPPIPDEYNQAAEPIPTQEQETQETGQDDAIMMALRAELERKSQDERDLKSAELERDVRRKRGLKDMAEGLGNIQMTTVGQMMYGERPEKFIAEDARRDVSEAEFAAAPENDPNSELSRATRSMMQGMGIPVDANMSYSQMMSMGPLMGSSAEAAYERQTASGDAIATERARILKDTTWKDFEGRLLEASNMKTMMDVNPLGVRASVIALVKSSGESGRLSDQDIQRFKRRAGWEGYLDEAHEFVFSDMTDAYKKQLRDLMEAIKKALKKNQATWLKQQARGFSNVPGNEQLDPNTLFQAVSPDLDMGAPDEQAGTTYVRLMDNGSPALDAQGNQQYAGPLSPEKAQELVKQGHEIYSGPQ